MTITIEEQGKPETAKPAIESQIDLQDYLLMAGVVFAESAAVVIWWPASLILASLFSFAFVYMIDRLKARESKSKK